VDAQIFEDQLALVRVGQPVAATVPAFPGEEFRGHVEQLAPALDPATRTLAVRFGLDNPRDRLRPGMLATVALDVAGRVTTLARGATCPVTRLRLGTMGPAIQVEVQGRRVSVCCEACVPKLKATPEKYLEELGYRDTATPNRVMSVPESAVIDTGTKSIVYVEASPGVFEGRAVVLGARSGDSFPVLDGLAPGDRIAAAGAFLIDAETRLNPPSRSVGLSAAADDPR
jgi:Cu(I)/Ag(I) efflux system membrane fusion protein